MIENVPLPIPIFFGLITLISFIWFYFATGKSNLFLIVTFFWITIQTYVGLSGFYLYKDAIPPRILIFGLFPTLIFIIVLFLTKNGRAFIDSINLKTLTYFHTIRIPVEMVLYMLYSESLVSKYMTFEGTNFDLFSGITAPFVAYWVFKSNPIKKRILLIWNFVCLALLANVVITAILAFPTPFQVLSLNQPNVAVMYFPFNLLPVFIVPLVLFAHVVAIRTLIKEGKYMKPYNHSIGYWNPADDLHVTVEDYSKFLISAMNNEGLTDDLIMEREKIISDLTKDPIWGTQDSNKADFYPPKYGYGLGWMVFDYGDGNKNVQHGGNDEGEASMAYYHTKSKNGLIVFCNGGNGVFMLPKIVELLDEEQKYTSVYNYIFEKFYSNEK